MEKTANDSLRAKTVYIIPSYIFSQMIVHMLRILSEYFALPQSVSVCVMVKVVQTVAREGRKEGNDNEPKSIPPTTPFAIDVCRCLNPKQGIVHTEKAREDERKDIRINRLC